jgi:hypothetical protein
MKQIARPHLIALAASLLVASVQADDATPRPTRVFEEKPRIEDYQDYSAFLVDIMEYRRQQALAAQAPREPAPEPAPLWADPYRINGPETLDQALERARFLAHPAYDEPYRYNRTTSQSFPLPQMGSTDMSDSGVEGELANLAGPQPAVRTDDSALAYADDVLGSGQKGEANDQEQVRANRASTGETEVGMATDRKTGARLDSDLQPVHVITVITLDNIPETPVTDVRIRRSELNTYLITD